MIFVEFDCREPSQKIYFVGKTLADILADTANGTAFGGSKLSGYREVNAQDVEQLKLKYYSAGTNSILDGECVSFCIGSPHDKPE